MTGDQSSLQHSGPGRCGSHQAPPQYNPLIVFLTVTLQVQCLHSLYRLLRQYNWWAASWCTADCTESSPASSRVHRGANTPCLKLQLFVCLCTSSHTSVYIQSIQYRRRSHYEGRQDCQAQRRPKSRAGNGRFQGI